MARLSPKAVTAEHVLSYQPYEKSPIIRSSMTGEIPVIRSSVTGKTVCLSRFSSEHLSFVTTFVSQKGWFLYCTQYLQMPLKVVKSGVRCKSDEKN